MLSILHIVLQFALNASSPQWSCALTHREPYVAGTFYLYCSKTTPSGVVFATVGRFVSDKKASL